MSETSRPRLGDPDRRLLTTANAVRQSHTVVGVAGDKEPRRAVGKGFNPADAVEVADMVLRHLAVPAGDANEVRLSLHAEDVPQFIEHHRHEVVVGLFEQFRLQGSAR